MFKKEYQGGVHVDVFSAQGRDPTSQCRLVGSVKRLYDKDLHGYVYTLEGGFSSTASRLQMPKDERSTLGLVQRCLVLQLNLPQNGRLAVEVCVTDRNGSRQRINLSTSVRELSSSPLHARVPLANLTVEKWQHLCIDLESLISGLFKGQHFKSLDKVVLGGSFSLRRIITLRTSPSLAAGGEFPKSCQMPPGVDTPQTFIVSYESVTDSESVGEGEEQGVEQGEGHSIMSHRTKAPIPEQTSISRKSSRSLLSAGREPVTTQRRQLLTARSDTDTASELSLEAGGRGLRPYPPSDPSNPTMAKLQQKRVHLRSGGKKKQVEPAKELLISDGVSTGDQSEMGMGEREGLSEGKREGPSDEELAVVDILKTAESAKKKQVDVGEQMDTSCDDVTSEMTYFYLSHPKSASDVKQSISMATTSRGGNLDDDFVTSENDQGYLHNDQGHPHNSDDVNMSRLSDDYDWRQYTSRDDGSHDWKHRDGGGHREELALRERLEVRPTRRTSVEVMDNSLTGSTSMTLSGWTERFREAAHGVGGALQDSLDIRDMGGTLTPALGNTLTEQPDFPVDLPGDVQATNDQELDLMYDPQLNCFYDPVTNKYYELVQ